MEEYNRILSILGLLTFITAMYSLMRTKNIDTVDGGDAKGIPPSRGQAYPIYLWIIFAMAFAITLIFYFIYKYTQ